jgi:type IV secretory pathway TrbD component
MAAPFVADTALVPRQSEGANAEVSVEGSSGKTDRGSTGKEGEMYISSGVLALIVIVVLLVWLL